MRFESSTVINRPIEEVFDYASDPAHVPEWQIPVISCQQTSSGPPGKGTTAVARVKVLGRQFDIPSENTEWNRPHGFKVHNSGGPMPMDLELRFASEAGGTRVDMISDMEVARMLQMAAPLIEPVVSRQMQGSLDGLKAILESQVPATAAGQTE